MENPEDPAIETVELKQYQLIRRSRNRYQLLAVVSVALVIGLFILTILINNDRRATVELLETRVKVADQQRMETYEKLKKLEEQKVKYEEVQDLLQELELRNINDMKDYIQARYSKVPQELAELIAKTTHDKCIEHGADFATVVGIMEVESAFNPFAVSHADARGLMQVLPKVWMEPLGISDKTDFHDISVGIDSGIRVYLQYLQEQKGDIKRALNQYNGCSLDKGPYAPQIFEAIGRFTAYRNNSYTGTIDQEQNESTEETEKNGRAHKSVPN
jgi:hypothetical protein